MKIKIPNFKKILKPIWKHKVGYGMISGAKHTKQDILEQGTTPLDKNLLKKLGIKKGDKILAIAGYYASWASELQKAGANVDYSDISKSLVSWVKKNVKTKFRKYIVSNYELIPKKEKEYDWTFTYEACGGKQGLPIAYLRSLLNKKGGILVYFINKDRPDRIGGKAKTYPNIIDTLSKIYNTRGKYVNKKVFSRRKDKYKGNLEFFIGTILTNASAREKALEDLATLEKSKGSPESLRRLSQLIKLFDSEFIKEIKLK